MKTVSNAYRKSMQSSLRNPSYAKITLQNVDVEAKFDGSWAANTALEWSNLTTLDVSHEYPAYTYATLELNRWTLDGKNQVIIPASDIADQGYVSDAISNADGTFDTSPVLTRAFTDTHDLLGMTFTFDSRCDIYPIDISLTYYAGDTVIGTEVFSSLTGVTSGFAFQHSGVSKIEMQINTALPYSRVRAENALFGLTEVYDNSDIGTVSQSHDVDPLSRRLPSETLQFTIIDYSHRYDPDNPKGIYEYIDTGSPVSIQYGYELDDGSIEWIKSDNYVLKSKPTTSNNLVTFYAQGLIATMTGTYYKSKPGEKTLYDMAIDVLTDANLPLTAQGKNPWEIDDALKQMTTTAILPVDSHADCLQMIAHAACSKLYTDDSNIVHIKPFGVLTKNIYSGTWSDNGHIAYSETDSLTKGYTGDSTYVTMELNRWTLDGKSQIILVDNPVESGYISSQISDADGLFTDSPELTRTFDLTHDFGVIRLVFDNVLDEYPYDLQLQFYKGNTLVSTQNVYPDAEEIVVTGSLADDADKLVITPYQTFPYSRMRVTKVGYRETDFVLNFTTIQENSQVISQIDKLKEVTVAKYSYVRSSESVADLWDGTTSDTSLHLEFDNPVEELTVEVTGGTLTDSVVYGRAADLTFTAGEKTIKVTGYSLSENSQIVHFPVADDGEVDAETNCLITNDTMCNALGEHVKMYLALRNTYDANYRGNPEIEVGDMIGLQTRYTDEMDAIVLTDGITFDGSLSGLLKVKGLV